MKCSNCDTENPDGSIYCRGCGSELLCSHNVIDRYPAYKLIPKTIYELKTSKAFKVVFIIFSIPYLFLVLWTTLGCLSISSFIYEFTLVVVGFVFSLLIYYWVWLKTEYLFAPNRYRKRKGLLDEYDYIQSYTSRGEHYVFIVKDQKFGLYDVKRINVQLSPSYDFLGWKNKGILLNAIKEGRHFTIDIYGNELK